MSDTRNQTKMVDITTAFTDRARKLAFILERPPHEREEDFEQMTASFADDLFGALVDFKRELLSNVRQLSLSVSRTKEEADLIRAGYDPEWSGREIAKKIAAEIVRQGALKVTPEDGIDGTLTVRATINVLMPDNA